MSGFGPRWFRAFLDTGSNIVVAWAIALSFMVTGLLFARRADIAAAAKPLLWLVVGIFLCGMLLTTARNDQIVYPFFAAQLPSA